MRGRAQDRAVVAKQGDWAVENLLRPVLLAGMMVCLATPPVLGLEVLLGGWRGSYFLAFAFLAGLEGILSERALRRRRITGWAYVASRTAELVVLLLLLKGASYLAVGLDQLWADVRLGLIQPGSLLTEADQCSGLLLVLLWQGAIAVGHHVTEMDADEIRTEAPPDKTSAEYYLWLTAPSPVRDRQSAFRWLADAVVWGGMVLLIGAAAVHALRTGSQAATIAVMLYFALGVALLSQARFSVARAAWQTEGIAVQKGVARRWLVWAALFLSAVSLVAWLLPTEYGLGPVMAIYAVLSLIAQAVLVAFSFVLYFIGLLLALIMPSMKMPDAPAQGVPQVPAPLAAAAGDEAAWLKVVLTGLFWLLMLVILAVAVVRFVRDRWGEWQVANELEGTRWGRLLGRLRALWQRWLAWRRGVQARLDLRRTERTAGRATAMPMLRFLSLRTLSPQQLVRYFYLSTLRRAAQAGRRRGAGQTPYEYAAELGQHVPELEPDLTGLTAAFVRARYDPRPVEPAQAEAVKPLWQRIRARLRRRRVGHGDSGR